MYTGRLSTILAHTIPSLLYWQKDFHIVGPANHVSKLVLLNHLVFISLSMFFMCFLSFFLVKSKTTVLRFNFSLKITAESKLMVLVQTRCQFISAEVFCHIFFFYYFWLPNNQRNTILLQMSEVYNILPLQLMKINNSS